MYPGNKQFVDKPTKVVLPGGTKAGLEDVLAGYSKICRVDGEAGELFYSGYNIHELAQAQFEEVVYLLWNGELPKKSELEAISAKLNKACDLNPYLADLLKRFPVAAPPMAVLRTAISALGMADEGVRKRNLMRDKNLEPDKERAYRLMGQTAAIIAAFERFRRGQAYVPSGKGLSHAENFLYMLSGKKPTELEGKAFNVALILHADHELNASTFAARVTASTLADIYSAATSAIGALQGPLHGGANEEVMALMEEIGDISNAENVLAERLYQKRKIPGFGHRVYRTEDPRATHLRQMAKDLGAKLGDTKPYEMLKKIEEIMWREKKINANVDLYSAAVYHLLKIPTDLFTPIFALSRMAGWTAHILEQYADNRLMRPRAEYMGPHNRTFVPLEKR